jgi:hypothetical protein
MPEVQGVRNSYINQPTVVIFYVIKDSEDEGYHLLECDVI